MKKKKKERKKEKKKYKKNKNKIEIFAFNFLDSEEKSWDSGAIFYTRITDGFHLLEVKKFSVKMKRK